MAKNLNKKQREEIKNMYLSGMSQKDIINKTGYTSSTVSKHTKGLRSHKEAVKLARSQGKGEISDKGREKLSIAGKQACMKNKKFYTKPEKEFIKILRKNRLKVKIPDFISEITSEYSDKDGEIFYQYPLQRYVCDFVWLKKKIIFNVNGDFWHANPLLYNYNDLCEIQKFNLKQDNNKKKFLQSKGFTTVDVWESEIYWNIEIVKQKIQAAREQVNPSVLHTEDARIVTEVAHSDWSEKLKKLWFKKPRQKQVIKIKCQYCKDYFDTTVKSRKKFCSMKCWSLYRRKTERPTKKELEKMIKEMAWTAIAKQYKVSDNSIRKWAKQYGLI